MKRKENQFNVVIDAAGRSLGRVATEVAIKLRGKHLPLYYPNKAPAITVKVINVEKIILTGTKSLSKKYYHFSGYPGGLRQTTLGHEFAKNPVKLFRSVVKHMLPKNKLNKVFLNNLIIIKGDNKEG